MDCALCAAHVTKAARSVAGGAQGGREPARGGRSWSSIRRWCGRRRSRRPLRRRGIRRRRSGRRRTRARRSDGGSTGSGSTHTSGSCGRWRGSRCGAAGVHAQRAAVVRRAPGGASWSKGGIGWMDWLRFATATVAIVFIGAGFYRSAWRALVFGDDEHGHADRPGRDRRVPLQPGRAGRPTGGMVALPALYFMESTGLLAFSLGHYLECGPATGPVRRSVNSSN